jgi:hypothetical protein
MKDEELLFFNGINGESGAYEMPPMTGLELSGFIQGERPPDNLNELRIRFRQSTNRTLGVKDGVDPMNLSEAGWGAIFSSDADPAIKEALQDLLALRQQQAGANFKIYEGEQKGYRPDLTKTDFLAENDVGPGPADPEKVPYYLLIVGSPEKIPYQFQTQLDVQYAVGRIHFDSPQEYHSYARSVIAAETGQVKLPRQIAFFGVSNPDDRATQLSTENLVAPLQAKSASSRKDWQVNGYLTPATTQKAHLSRLLGGDQTPALLFTAGHGMSFPLGSPRQEPHQGALLCQDWPGPVEWEAGKPIPQDFYFAGDDLITDSGLLGTIAFFFACYGAGTPLNDAFSRQAFKQRTAISKAPFLARLPARMLSLPRGGALAVIGHIERAWSYSFAWPKAGSQTIVFDSSLARLLKGCPVGYAFEYFNTRYAELSTVLSDELEDIEFNKKPDAIELSRLWTANNDARDYIIIGDPAVRLPVAAVGETPLPRPMI